MRIISLWQPFATLMVMGLKTNETRSWDTKYRGKLGIHATASMPPECKRLLQESPFYELIGGLHLPLGAILGTVEVVGTMRTEDWLIQSSDPDRAGFDLEKNLREIAFGNYDDGRYAWKTINPVRFDNPIPAKGMQGFWNYDLSTIDSSPTGQLSVFG